MAWQVLVLSVIEESPPPISECNEEHIQPLGSPGKVRARIDALFPTTDWRDPTSGHYVAEDQGFSIVFHVRNVLSSLTGQ